MLISNNQLPAPNTVRGNCSISQLLPTTKQSALAEHQEDNDTSKHSYSLDKVHGLHWQHDKFASYNCKEQLPQHLPHLKPTPKNKMKFSLGRRQVKHNSFLYSFSLLPCCTDDCFISFFCFQERLSKSSGNIQSRQIFL